MSSHDSGFYQFNDPPNISPEEQSRVAGLSGQAYSLLCRQSNRSMSLGDFAAELRDLDILSSTIDAIIEYMTTVNWVWLWKNRDTEEMWITAYEPEDDSDDDDDDGQPPGAHQGGQEKNDGRGRRLV